METPYKHLNPQTQLGELFDILDKTYFDGLFSDYNIDVKWSAKMKKKAGACGYKRGVKLLKITLSTPILSSRSNWEIIDILLHEMVHAYTIIKNLKLDHGSDFQACADKIRKKGGYEIKTCHRFFKEAKASNTFFWKCDQCYTVVGRTNKRKPTFKHGFHNIPCNGVFRQTSKCEYEKFENEKTKKRKISRETSVNKKKCIK